MPKQELSSISVEELLTLIEEIKQVACGEHQVANDDTEGMEWIYKRILAAQQKAIPAEK
jgi:hypothetical protein